MEVLEEYRYFIRYDVESWLDQSSEDDGYLTRVHGSVLFAETSNDEDGVLCGHIRACHLRCDDMQDNDDYDPRGWGNHEGGELAEITRSLYTEDGGWSRDLRAMWAQIDPMDLLVISEIELNRDHRGRALGLQVIERTLKLVGGNCGVAALCPWPTKATANGNVNAAYRAHVKIATHAERLGFRRLAGSDVWVRSLVHEIDQIGN